MGQSQTPQGLYRPEFEHDNCGIGAVVNIRGKKSHRIVTDALRIVEHLEHRAGKDAEGKTGDGVGILTQISHRFFEKVCKPLHIHIGGERDYGVGMFFFPQDELKRNQAKNIFEVIVKKEGLNFLGWREVPIHPEVLGKTAVDCMPCILQAFIERPERVEKGIDFDRRLYVVRRVFEQSSDDTYVVSLSSRTIVYKGMFLVGQLRQFFGDLQDEDYESAIAMVHSRFSTNTAPSWQRAHPNRFIVHNGEINTIQGNADKMLAREENMVSPYFKGKIHKTLPVIDRSGSDSAMLDNTLEFLVMSGMHLALMMPMMADFFETGIQSGPMTAGAFATWACFGVALGAALRMRSKDERSEAFGAFASGIPGGVTEPTLYGICFQHTRCFIGLIAGGFVGGAIAGMFDLKGYVMTSANFLSVLGYVGGTDTNLIVGIVASVMSLVVAAVCVALIIPLVIVRRRPALRDEVRRRFHM